MTPSGTSIQRRLMVSISVAVILLFALSGAALYLLMQHAFNVQLDKHLLRTIEDFVAETERKPDGSVESDFHELDLEIFRNGGEEGGAYYELRDYRSKPLIRSKSLDSDEELPISNTDLGKIEFEPITLQKGVPGRVVLTSFTLRLEEFDNEDPGDLAEITARTPEERAFVESYDENDPINRVFLAVAEDTLEARQALLILSLGQNITGIILAITAFLLIRKIVHSAFKPIVEISQLTEGISPENLNIQLPLEQVPTEIRPLIVKFNEFIERVSGAMQRERRFSADLAHEIRTPVTEIRSLLEVAAHTTAVEDDAHEIYELGAEISRRMSKMIEVITAIHQENTGKLELSLEPVSIEQLLKEGMALCDSQVQLRFCFKVEGEEGREIKSDPHLLRAVIDNLLINGVAHSPADSEITIACQESGFSIENITSDLNEEDLKFMNEPFWQKDDSHSRVDHFGLGLALVAAYLRLLDGRIEHQLEGGRLITKVTLLDKMSAL